MYVMVCRNSSKIPKVLCVFLSLFLSNLNHRWQVYNLKIKLTHKCLRFLFDIERILSDSASRMLPIMTCQETQITFVQIRHLKWDYITSHSHNRVVKLCFHLPSMLDLCLEELCSLCTDHFRNRF